MRRWALVAHPIQFADPDWAGFSEAMALAANANPDGPFLFRRSAVSAARFHEQFLPIRYEVVDRRQP